MGKMEWGKLLNFSDFSIEQTERKHKLDLSRTPFHKDYDRIIFSEEFRRLDKKTQVHPLKINDHVHARLSHSLETSCVGRSLGAGIGVFLTKLEDFLPYPDDIGIKKNSDAIMPIIISQIVQAACLAHDIGNPPFGHAGEELLQDWFREQIDATNMFDELTDEEKDDLRSFEGNAQAFRILARTGMKKNHGGMGITYAVLGSMIKYPWVYSDKLSKKKFGSFISEKEYLKKVAERCGLLDSSMSKEGYSFCRHPFAFLSEAADDICYNIMDLEDAYELKILDYESVYNIFAEMCRNSSFDPSAYKNSGDKSHLAHMRAIAINECRKSAIADFERNYENIITGKLPSSHSLAMNNGSHEAEMLNEAKKLANTRVFPSERKTQLEVAANQVLSTILKNFITAVYALHTKNTDEMSGYDKKLLSLMGTNRPLKDDTLFAKYQKVTDFIAGMTDNYAIRIAANMNGNIV